jgi:transposase
MNQPQVEIKVLNIDHLGIIAGIIDKMELVELVNKQVGIKEKEMLTPGQIMKAMILNGLGFLSAPLYLERAVFDRQSNRTSHWRRSITITFK